MMYVATKEITNLIDRQIVIILRTMNLCVHNTQLYLLWFKFKKGIKITVNCFQIYFHFMII